MTGGVADDESYSRARSLDCAQDGIETSPCRRRLNKQIFLFVEVQNGKLTVADSWFVSGISRRKAGRRWRERRMTEDRRRTTRV